MIEINKLVILETGQNCNKTKLQKVTKLHEGNILHKKTVAQGQKTARV